MPLNEPNMSDRALLLSVEDLICIAFGPNQKNIVNFKVIQTVLHILARQQRMLEQRVEIRITEVREEMESSSPSSSPRAAKSRRASVKKERPTKADEAKRREEKERERLLKAQEKAEKSARREKEKAERSASKEREKAERAASKEREKAERAADKAERSASREREKAERAAEKERDRAEKAAAKEDRSASKEREKADRAAEKEREKAEKAAAKEERSASKERERAEKAAAKEERSASKEREKAERAAAKEERSASKEREKVEKAAEKERERADRAAAKEERSASKEREKAERAAAKEERSASKEREKAEKAAEKEREKADKAAEKEKERAEKAAAKEERSASKEREKAEKAAEKEREKADKAAEKEKERAEKAAAKEERSASKEREKAEKAAEKERERADKAEEKEREKAERSASKEREKAERAAEKEREKAEKEKDKAERSASKEREKAERAAEKEAARAKSAKGGRDTSLSGKKPMKGGREESVSSINISEVERGKEKVLVVEKGPTTRSETRAGSGGIDVVTQSQFALLEAAVRGLEARAAPMGELRMPDNQQLKTALARGSASLTDTMQAMQVNARVKAAEEAIDRMAGLLTQLAAAGAVPEALAGQVAAAKRDAERALASDSDEGAPIRIRPSTARKSVAIDPTARSATPASARGSVSTVLARSSLASRPSSTASAASVPKVTRDEMEDMVKAVKADLIKNMNAMAGKATAAADNAMNIAKAVAEKLDVALQLDKRISSLHGLVADYAEQLSGFDVGLTTQMQSFQEQMLQIRSDLAGGLKLLETANNNAETAAVMELTERYEELAGELERTVGAHRALSSLQGRLGDELHNLVECVEMLREQKADRDEVIDGLRDKADSSRLAGLLTEAEFALTRAELARRLDLCHEKFRRQDSIWMGAIKDLLRTTDQKAEIIELMSMRDDTQRQLRELHATLRLLAAAVGEPKAALLARQISRDGHCGACGAFALAEPVDAAAGAPPALPALRPAPREPEPCLTTLQDYMPTTPHEDRHTCLRWCGGSHTLVSDRTTRERAPPMHLEGAPTRKFTDYGMDGRLYMMEEELQPCLECNALLQRTPPVGEDGAGDQGQRPTVA